MSRTVGLSKVALLVIVICSPVLPQEPTSVETLSQCLLRRYRVYERVWDCYLMPSTCVERKVERKASLPTSGITKKTASTGDGLTLFGVTTSSEMSRSYTDQEKQEFIRTIAALDEDGKSECRGKPVE